MSEVKQQVQVFRVNYQCDGCHADNVYPTGFVLTSYPAQYPHVCRSCGFTITLLKRYPCTDYVEVTDEQ